MTETDVPRIFVLTITGREFFRDAVATALSRICGDGLTLVGVPASAPGAEGADPARPRVYDTLADRARTFLASAMPQTAVEVVAVPGIEHLQGVLRVRTSSPDLEASQPLPFAAATPVLCLVDATSAVPGGDTESRVDATIAFLDDARGEFGLGLSPYSVLIYDELPTDHTYGRTTCSVYALPAESWELEAAIVRAFTDLIQARATNPKAPLPGTEPPTTLATALTSFLTRQAGDRWALHLFTGSIVAKFIQDATTAARHGGNPVLRGPNEHSLAAGALARWQLHRAPFLIAVTAGMVDELRGTLANLRDAQAKGFIVFGDAGPGMWWPFQGTVHTGEDSRAVFAAKGLPCFYLTDPARLGEELAAAFRAYHQGSGPVVLLVAPQVLQYTGPADVPTLTVATASPRADDEVIDQVADIINHDPATLVWQCGPMTENERDQVYRIADRAGIALTDSLARPGTVARYHHGQVVEEYLGTMSLYGYSRSVWRFLTQNGHLKSTDQQALFFLNSRIPDLAVPFPEKQLYDQVRIIQLTDRPDHIAPFADLAIVEKSAGFLERLAVRIKPEHQIVQSRKAAILQARQDAYDPYAELPSVPMSHEYFFTRLSTLLQRLITQERYTYTGFYDTGRGGISAIRNLPRTGPGFSGWYGRAIMGDALHAIPAIALTSPGNILGFIGDGAAMLTPSILPMLAQQLLYERGRITGNITLFMLLNGGYSVIRTYREYQQATTADSQMSLLTPIDPPWQRTRAGVTFNHEHLISIDPDHLTDRLQQPSTVNIFSVFLDHDNEGDDLIPAGRKHWRYR
jgi:thiamine pyrophosphate-dependent acetolactate synthase large subunit-like protein